MIAIWAAVILFAAIHPVRGETLYNQIQVQIRQQFNAVAAAMVNTTNCGMSIQKAAESVMIFYTERNFEPAWVDENGIKPESSLLIRTISNVESEGLPKVAYPIETIERLSADAIFMAAKGSRLSADLMAQLDISLSTAFFLHSAYFLYSRLEMDYDFNAEQLNEYSLSRLVQDLEHALSTHTIDALLGQLTPHQQAYEKLKAVKKRYEIIVAAGGWPELPDGPKLEMCDQNRRVGLLRERLMRSNDLAEPPEKEIDYFDEGLKNAVRHFQLRHGLEADGIVGPSTLSALNVSAEKRLTQIIVNLERWRQLPRDLGERYIEVNIPDFRLKVVDQGETVRSMRVVVGKTTRPTPVLSGLITYLEINPYWTVPPQIARKDILPKIQEDPAYLTRQNIRVYENWMADAAELNPDAIDWRLINANHFPYKLRQEPVAGNALGQVKFMFPNKLNVYLHDTPSKELFAREQRSFSSGCVRVENPMELAEYLLNEDKGWDRQALNRIIEGGSSKVILLKKPMPVYLLYWTAWAEKNGEVHFRNDLYGRDEILMQAIKQQLPDFKTCQNSLPTNYLMISNNSAQLTKSNNNL